MEDYQDLKDNFATILSVGFWILFAGLALLYAILYIKASSAYMPVWIDEPGYYLNAASFARNTTLSAALTLGDHVSPLGKCDTHGFAYPLLHGAIARICGLRHTNLLTANMAALVLCLAALLAGRVAVGQCAAAMTLIMLYFITPVYGFSDMQESLHILFATVAAVLLWQIHRRQDSPLSRSWLIGAYIAAIGIFTLFRPGWAVWLLALGPLSVSRRETAWFTGMLFVAVTLTLIYASVGFAPFPSGLMFHTVQPAHGSGPLSALQQIVANGTENMRLFFMAPASLAQGRFKSLGPYFFNSHGLNYYYLTKIVYLFLILFFVVHGAVWRDRLSLGLAAAGLGAFALMILLYDASQYRESPLAALYVIGAVVLAARQFRVTTGLLIVLMLVMFPPVLRRTSTDIEQRNAASRRLATMRPMAEALALVGREIAPARPVTVYVSGAIGSEKSLFALTSLPVRSAKGFPIRYSINTQDGSSGQGIAQMAAKVDYIMYLRPGAESSVITSKAVKGMTILGKNEYLEFYRTNRQ